ncbi:MAG TPA: hypothetical protein VGD07_01030 [Methylomirabilota bacterium]
MAKVGRFVIDPKLGAYCMVALDDGKKILVNHENDAQGGRMMVAESKWWGGETLLDVRLDTPEGKAAVPRLTAGAAADSPRATPLGALVDALKDCASLDDVRARCQAIRAAA